MPFAQRIAGAAFVQVDGKMVTLHGGLIVGQSKTERAMVFGQEGLGHGYVERYRAPFVDIELSLPLPGMELEVLERQTDVTVIAQFGNGLQYVLSRAVCTFHLDAQARDGKVRVRWEGMKCIEIRPSQPPWPEEVVKDNGEEEPELPLEESEET